MIIHMRMISNLLFQNTNIRGSRIQALKAFLLAYTNVLLRVRTIKKAWSIPEGATILSGLCFGISSVSRSLPSASQESRSQNSSWLLDPKCPRDNGREIDGGSGRARHEHNLWSWSEVVMAFISEGNEKGSRRWPEMISICPKNRRI